MNEQLLKTLRYGYTLKGLYVVVKGNQAYFSLITY